MSYLIDEVSRVLLELRIHPLYVDLQAIEKRNEENKVDCMANKGRYTKF